MAAVDEKTFQRQVTELATYLGWQVNHTRKSIGGRKQGWVTATTVKGMPDLLLWSERQQRIVFAELKVPPNTTTIEQKRVLASLRLAGAEVYVWRPADLDDIAGVLRARAFSGSVR